VVVYDVFSVADTVSKSAGGTFDGDVTLTNIAGGAVFNEDSADVDFRVESNGQANMLFVDGGNDRVGIGTNSPSEVFEVHSGAGNIGAKFVSTDALAVVAYKDNSTSDVVFAGASGDNFAVSHDILFTNASKGVYLGVTSATAANLLNDYEEGTFTPVFAFGGSTNGLTYGNKVGSYTKVGNRVHTSGIVQLTGKDGAAIGSGTVTIVGFPFTVTNNNNAYAAAGLRMQNITFADSPSLATIINSTTADLREITNAGSVTTLNNGNIAADSYVIFSLSYQTDA